MLILVKQTIIGSNPRDDGRVRPHSLQFSS